ncbi:MAG TPA: dihydrolipoamide acetyltransferase family protein [Thermoleophilaceae bacterium]|nr:dihydrolipoamide acetyltransferase family protein [Thermoleophilaceae bacterium]
MAEITMPRLSDSMEEGTILKWLVSEGDDVKRGQPIAEIETDKANMTYESDTDGTVSELVASEGDTLAVGEVIARIGDGGNGGAPKAEKQEEEPAQEEPEEAEEQQDDEPKPEPSSNGGERVKASPVARRMAGEMGVELAQLEGSGPGGRILKADVEAAAKDGGAAAPERDQRQAASDKRDAQPEPQRGEAGAKGEVEIHELTRLQQTVTRRMSESKATAPDFQLTSEVDMTAAVELRVRLKEVADPAPSFNDMVVKAAAVALRGHPRVNAAYRDGKFELYSRVNVGIAVAAQDALVVPTIFDADTKSLGQIARDARGLIQKVHDGKVTPPEVSGGTFTVSNLGMYGIDSFSAVINPPQAAILTVGALKKKAVPDERGRIAARDMLSLTLVCDHRILYGADGAQFLARVRELLESPLSLAL